MHKSDLLLSVTVWGSSIIKIPLYRHKNYSYIPWTLCSWKIAWSPMETLRYITSLSSKFIRKYAFFGLALSL
jgi:hypothetical protein